MEVRADTYLWAVRMFKSRTLASEAIKGGKVKLGDVNFKPSHVVKIGERFTISVGDQKKIIEVVGLVDKRGNFETARKFYSDLTPVQTKEEKQAAAFFEVNIRRDKGSGRPTKKDRRDMNDFGWE
ncbi:MAG: RNA-binding S4 domain-containing protein [Bacteroidetes bacterium]|nr:RNA-binding S4 domain-containing protein [Bacteroidota bacterium]